jgi:putative phosphoesterase
VISDTHGRLRPEAVAVLNGCVAIVHAGDIGKLGVLDGLRGIAPLTVVRGNVDQKFDWAQALPDTATVTVAGRRIHVLHDRTTLAVDPRDAGIDVVVSGHSHRSGVECRDGVLYVNPGSAGPRRFRLPVTMAIIEITPDSVEARIVDLELGS